MLYQLLRKLRENGCIIGNENNEDSPANNFTPVNTPTSKSKKRKIDGNKASTGADDETPTKKRGRKPKNAAAPQTPTMRTEEDPLDRLQDLKKDTVIKEECHDDSGI